MARRSWSGGWFGLTLVLLVATAAGQTEQRPGPDLTLAAAVDRALQANPMATAADRGMAAAAARLDQAKAARLPFLELGETFTHGNNPVFAFGSLLEQGRFAERNFALDSLNNPGSLSNFRSTLNLRIPVFNRLQIRSGIEQARLGTEIADQSAGLVGQNIRYRVIQDYFGVLVAEARRDAARQAVDTAEAEAKRIGDLVDQGLLVSSDLLAAQVQTAEFRQALIQAEGAVESARASLNTVLGASIDSSFRIVGDISERRFESRTQSELIARALEGRLDLEQASRKVEIARQKLRAARGQYLPDFNLFAQFGQSSQELVGGSGDFTVGAKLTFNILDFGRSPRIREAEAEWQVAKEQMRQQSNQVSLEVVQAYRDFLAAEQRVTVAAGAVGQAEEALRIVRDRHGEGLSTITELLRAQTALLNGRFNLLGARYDYTLGYARILLVSGDLNDVSAFSR